jgi:hypothetical protein
MLAVAFVGAASIALAGCGGSKPAGENPTVTPIATGSTAASNLPASGVATAPGTKLTAAASSAPANAGGSTATSAASKPPAQATAKPPGKATGFTRSGTYTYDLSGTAQAFGGSQKVSGTQSLAVDPPAGSLQHSKSTDQQGSQDMTVQVKSSGLFVRDVHISQQGFDEDFKPVGAAMYFSADYSTGRHWSWEAKSTDGKYTINVSTKIAGTGTVSVGGKSDKAVIADSTLHITGSGFDITTQQRDWVSTTYALILKEHATTNGTAFGVTLKSDITRVLRSTTPS